MSNTNAAQKTNLIAESDLDPKAAHLHYLGSFTLRVLHAQVVVMTYIQPRRTKGGIILTEKAQDEDRFQGKAGLVIGMGPLAFKDDGVAQFGDARAQIGDWVMTRASDGMEFFYKGCSVRIFEDVHIKAIVTDPTELW